MYVRTIIIFTSIRIILCTSHELQAKVMFFSLRRREFKMSAAIRNSWHIYKTPTTFNSTPHLHHIIKTKKNLACCSPFSRWLHHRHATRWALLDNFFASVGFLLLSLCGVFFLFPWPSSRRSIFLFWFYSSA